MLLAVQTGLRASELTALTCRDVHLGSGAYVACHGKGRKDRITPLSPGTVATLRAWLAEHAGDTRRPAVPHHPRRADEPRRPPAAAHPLRHRGQDILPVPGQQKRHPARPAALSGHAPCCTPGTTSPSSRLWLGHESITTTQIYLQADMALKQQALDRTTPPATQPGRYQPPDQLLAFLEAL